MKKVLLLPLLFASVLLRAQSPFPVPGELVKVADWGSRSIMMGADFFLETKDSIISQVGAAEFEVLKDRCTAAGWPAGIYISGLSDEEDKAFDSTLNQLKMYRIATFTHRYRGKLFDRYVILRVPFSSNGDWNKDVTWEGNIYFLLKEKDLEQ